jgi:cell division protein FtsL
MPPAITVAGPDVRLAQRPLPRRRVHWTRWLETASTLSLAALVLAGALFYVWQHTRVVRMGYEIERLRDARAALVQEHKALRLEIGQLRALKRVEEIARTRLGMVTPRPGQVVLVREAPIQ